MEEELRLAREAIAAGVDSAAVAEMFKERTGQELPSEADVSAPSAPSADAGRSIADALVAFGNGAALGLPAALSKDTREYLGDARERAPGMTRAAAVAGSLALPVGTTAAAVRTTAGATITPLMRALMTGRSMGAPSALSALAARAGSAVAKPLAAGLGLGGGYAGLQEIIRQFRGS